MNPKKYLQGRLGKTSFIVSLVILTAGCSVVESRSYKEASNALPIERISVWSGVGRVSYQSRHVQENAPFKDLFKTALTSSLEKHGVTVIYAESTSLPNLTEKERRDLISHEPGNPSTRLLVQLKTVSSSVSSKNYQVDKAVFDLNLYAIPSGQRLWRAEVSIDSSVDFPRWGEKTANKFVAEIMRLLEKDRLLASS
jgi:hypothetical protein